MVMRKRARKLKPGETPPPPEMLITTNLQDTVCRKCKAPILIGYVIGVKTRLDPMWLNPKGELLALVSGLKTVQTQNGGRGKVFTRRPCHIEAGIPRWGKILAEHRCGQRWAAGCFDIPARKPSDNADPPF